MSGKRGNKSRVSEKTAKRNKLVSTLITALVVFIVIFIFSRSSSLSEWYMQSIYPSVAGVLSTVSGLFPFSLYDMLIIVVALYILKLVLFVIIKRTDLVDTLCYFIRTIIILAVWFYFAWGISYFREDFYKRTDNLETLYSAEDLLSFTTRFINDANNSYVYFDVMEREGIRQELENTYSKMYEELVVSYSNGKRRSKNMIFESFFTKMGISGYFGPFTNEIHINNYSLNFTYPFTLAHEMSHQFGIAKESEANLYAFLVCINSDDERIKYSAYVSVINYLLNDVRTLLPNEYGLLVSSIRPEILANLQQNREHWMSARNETLSNVQDRAYDTYLKSNRINTGRENYSEVVGLLISCYDTFITQ